MISSSYDYILYASGRHKILAPVSVLTVLISIIFQLILIPKDIAGVHLLGLGGRGAVIANIIAWFVWMIFQIFLCFRLLKINFNKQIIPMVIFAMFSVVFFEILVFNNNFSGKLIFFLMDLLLFFSGLIIFNIIDKNDRNLFLKLASLKRIGNEIIKELKIVK